LKVLIAGGAGYVGSTIASARDIADGPLGDRILSEHPDIYAVIHCAALIVVSDSVTDGPGYCRPNVVESLGFAAHPLRNGRQRLILRPSAASYRAGEDLTVGEDSPGSPYGYSKARCQTPRCGKFSTRATAPRRVGPALSSAPAPHRTRQAAARPGTPSTTSTMSTRDLPYRAKSVPWSSMPGSRTSRHSEQ
jgi:hypothetical protein